MILVESNRDKLLQTYLDMLNSRLKKPISIGRLKSILLDNLSYHGYLKNLSLASNYYLAGAARYYFNGDLTINDDLALYHTYHLRDEFNAARNEGKRLPRNSKDEWNVDVCERLNILIKILRDSYINSIGTSYELPEDFGTLPLDKLLKKYNSKINAVIKKTTPRPVEYNPVGKKYSYDILYTYDDAKKYMSATNPGPWCITTRASTFKEYQKEHDAHFIVFRKDNWENVKRRPNASKWVQLDFNELPKPQDDYGNSLIAYLQKNDSWEPVLITSRYNHGDNDTGDLEADNAYTLSEFCRITKITPKDLQTIYEIWKSNRGKFRSTSGIESKKNTILKLKELQIRINGGEKPFEISYTPLLGDGSNLRRGVFVGKILGDDEGEEDYKFIIDKGKIVFDTLIQDLYYGSAIATDKDANGRYPCKNCIVLSSGDGRFIIYNLRTHSVVSVDGIHVFREMGMYCGNDTVFYEVASKRDAKALINASTNMPLVLPNGKCFYNYIISNTGYDYRGYREIKATKVDKNDLIEIRYDENSTFFFDTNRMEFVDLRPEILENGINIYPHLNRNFRLPGFFSITYTKTDQAMENYSTDQTRSLIAYTKIFKNGQPFSIGQFDTFFEASIIKDRYIKFIPIGLKDESWKYMIYNPLKDELFNIDGKPVVAFEVFVYDLRGGFIEMFVKRTVNSNEIVVFTEDGEQVKNPIAFPSRDIFYDYHHSYYGYFFYKTKDFNEVYGWRIENTIQYYKEKLIRKIKMDNLDDDLGPDLVFSDKYDDALNFK